MRSMIREWCGLVLLAGVLGVCGSGCGWYDELVDQQDLRLGTAGRRAPAAPTVRAAPVYNQQQDQGQAQTEAARLRVELAALQDSQRRLLAQNGELQDDLAARDKELKELRAQLSGAESGRKTSDAEWQRRLDAQRETMEAKHQKAVDAMARKMADEMAGAVKTAQQAARTPVIAGEHTVRQGDVLSVIASAYGVSVKQLIAANGLKSDMIHVGQKLKIPAPTR